MKKILFFLLFTLVYSQALWAQTGGLVKDINVLGSSHGLIIHESIAVGNLIYMIAEDGIQGIGLWKSDGTAAGTVIVKELHQVYTGADSPAKLTYSNGNIYFAVRVYGGAYVLYKSDGTQAGTGPFGPLNSHALDPGVKSLIDINGTLYYDGTLGLMKTDGTEAGTVRLLELIWFRNEYVSSMTNLNGKLFFFVFQGGLNRLYKSDGTVTGTVAVSNPSSVFPATPLVAAGGNVYYTDFSTGGTKLYKANDTSPVALVKANLFGIASLTSLGNTLYFSAGEANNNIEFWKSDGTATGTVIVKNINTSAGGSSNPTQFTAVNGQLYFVATDGINGRELWKSNGTSAGTVLVKDIKPGNTDSNIAQLTAVGSKVAFNADDGSGLKLWQSNGVLSGTKILSDVVASVPVDANGMLYFSGASVHGPQLYKSTMVTGGTSAVTDISRQGSTPLHFTEVNGVSYFTADNGVNGRELWKTNGTTAGTVLVKDISSGAGSSNPDLLTNVNGTLFFTANDGTHGRDLWKSDGTAAGTVLVKDIALTPTDSIQGLINLNGTLFFGIISAPSNLQVWKSNGTSAGTVIVKDLLYAYSFNPVTMNGQLYFGASGGANGSDLWKSDGTNAGTVLVKDINADGASIYNSLVVAGNFIYYVLDDEYVHYLLVKSDGTSAGTTVIKEMYPENYASFSKLVAAGNLVYFSAYAYGYDDDIPGEYLWRTDGSEAGTIVLKRFDGLSEVAVTHNQIVVNDTFYFVPPDVDNGDQLWKSDGTIEGTQIVKKLGDAIKGATIRNTAAVGNTLYFTASDGVSGLEIWKTNGTAASTFLAYDMNPAGSTLFYEIAGFNNQLLISADNGQYGAELFKFQDAPAATVLRINSGGEAIYASSNRRFVADQYFNGTTQVSTAYIGEILNTPDAQLYREQRFGSAFNYSIPVTNGKLSVILHFAEIYWGVPSRGGSAGTGKRKFNVDIEGSRKLTNYDIFTAAGGAMRALTQTFSVTVTDGILNINFLSGSADKPIIAAIEILPDVQISLDAIDDATVRNTPYENGHYGTATTLDVKSGSLPSYQRNTYLKFLLDGVTDVGSAKVRLYGQNIQNNNNISLAAFGVANDSWMENQITWNNAPNSSGVALGTVLVNGTPGYYEIDVTAYVKSQLQVNDKTVSLFLTNPTNQNTQLTFNSEENSGYTPQLVIRTAPPTAPLARIGVEENIAEVKVLAEDSRIYPNPAGKRVNVYVSGRHTGNVDLQLVGMNSNVYQVKPSGAINPASNVEVDLSNMHLSKGIYIMRIQSAAFKEAIRILVAE